MIAGHHGADKVLVLPEHKRVLLVKHKARAPKLR